MGWKGTVRAISAAAKRAERESHRRQKMALVEEAIEEAAHAVDSWEQYIEGLISVHGELAKPMNWKNIVNSPKPSEPKIQNDVENKTSEALSAYKPSWLHIFKGGTENLRKNLRII